MKRVLVTGATGFVGRTLCRRLRDQAFVVGLARRAADGPWDRLVSADLTREGPPTGAVEGVDTVFHLAARTHAFDERCANEAAYRGVNVDGTRRVLEAARAHGVRAVVFASSVKAMGERAEGADESTTPVPATAYGRTKLEAERLVLEGGYVPHPVVLRLSAVYGPNAPGQLAHLVAAVRRGRLPGLPPGGRRSMVHVEDVAEAAILAAAHSAAVGNVFIVTDGEPLAAREIADVVRRACGQRAQRAGVPLPALRALARAGDVVGLLRGRRAPFDSAAFEKLFAPAWYDDRRLRDALGFAPRRAWSTSIAEIVEGLDAGC